MADVLLSRVTLSRYSGLGGMPVGFSASSRSCSNCSPMLLFGASILTPVASTACVFSPYMGVNPQAETSEAASSISDNLTSDDIDDPVGHDNHLVDFLVLERFFHRSQLKHFRLDHRLFHVL